MIAPHKFAGRTDLGPHAACEVCGQPFAEHIRSVPSTTYALKVSSLGAAPAERLFPVGTKVRLTLEGRRAAPADQRYLTGVVLDGYEGQFCVKVRWGTRERVEHVDYLERVIDPSPSTSHV